MASLYITTLLLGVIGSRAVDRCVDIYDYYRMFGLDVNFKKDLCIDIVFALDRSCSIPEEDLHNEYRIIEETINGIAGFGRNKTRIGLVTFDINARVVFGFNDEATSTREGLLAKLRELKREGTAPDRCKTFTWEALKLAREDPRLFGGVDKNSDREKIIMLVTDGVPFETEKNREEMADETIAEGALNDAAGIKTMIFTLKNKQGNLPPKNIFETLVYSMRWMFQVEDALVQEFEVRVFPLLARFTCDYICNEPVDLIYVMDRSVSIEIKNIQKVKDFYKKLTVAFDCGNIRNRTHPKTSVSMISYNRNVYHHLDATDCPDGDCILDKIDAIPSTHEYFTVTNLALEEVKTIVNQFTRHGGSRGIRPVVILATDGNTWKVDATSRAPPSLSIGVADELRARGIDTVVVSVPNHRDKPGLKELEGIASHFLFDLQSELNLTSFDDLNPIAPILVKLLCEKYKPPLLVN
ncbi:unnamed protein product [Owenia fusiformis]|uniref:Uncharacterized protein n=1 Tax=Owenia fusiformis TaxID=6347 RepID=A0A8J1U631_OWEFU|nr:unnamed protein product [Owenia fusiformis]